MVLLKVVHLQALDLRLSAGVVRKQKSDFLDSQKPPYKICQLNLIPNRFQTSADAVPHGHLNDLEAVQKPDEITRHTQAFFIRFNQSQMHRRQ